MTLATLSANEYSVSTRSYAVNSPHPYVEATTPKRDAVVQMFKVEKVAAPVVGATDIDDFVNELLAEDPAFAQDLQNARKRLGREIFQGRITLKSLRLSKGMSQSDLARKVGTSQSHIARLEKNPEAMMMTTGVRLAKALDTDVSLIAALADGATIETGI